MKRKSFTYAITAILLGSVSLVSVAASTSDDAVLQTAGNVPYVSGGVGTDSINRLTALSGDFNLKLVFALKSGDYVSDVKVSIADVKGKIILDTTSNGPWLLTKLPPGNYQIIATFAGAPEKRTIVVGAGKMRTVDFRWASD